MCHRHWNKELAALIRQRQNSRSGHPRSQVLKIEILKSLRTKRAPGACLNPGPPKVHLDPRSQVLKVEVLKTWQSTYNGRRSRAPVRRPTGPSPAFPDSQARAPSRHGRSLVPSTSGAWPGGGVLRCCRREKRRRRTEERRKEEKRR